MKKFNLLLISLLLVTMTFGCKSPVQEGEELQPNIPSIIKTFLCYNESLNQFEIYENKKLIKSYDIEGASLKVTDCILYQGKVYAIGTVKLGKVKEPALWINGELVYNLFENNPATKSRIINKIKIIDNTIYMTGDAEIMNGRRAMIWKRNLDSNTFFNEKPLQLVSNTTKAPYCSNSTDIFITNNGDFYTIGYLYDSRDPDNKIPCIWKNTKTESLNLKLIEDTSNINFQTIPNSITVKDGFAYITGNIFENGLNKAHCWIILTDKLAIKESIPIALNIKDPTNSKACYIDELNKLHFIINYNGKNYYKKGYTSEHIKIPFTEDSLDFNNNKNKITKFKNKFYVIGAKNNHASYWTINENGSIKEYIINSNNISEIFDISIREE